MNRYFDFTTRQLKFLAFLTALLLVLSAVTLIKSYSTSESSSPPLEVIIGEDHHVYTGIFVLDPNTAPVDSLELLPGIGKVLADRIVEYRQDNTFETEIDITDVKGISAKMYEKLKPYLKVRNY